MRNGNRDRRGRSEREEYGMSHRPMAAEHHDITVAKWASNRVDIRKGGSDGSDADQARRNRSIGENRAKENGDRCMSNR